MKIPQFLFCSFEASTLPTSQGFKEIQEPILGKHFKFKTR